MKIERRYSNSSRIKELIRNIEVLNDYNSRGETPKFQTLKFVTPISILPIASFLQKHNLDFELGDNIDENAESYLETIDFPQGADYFFDTGTYMPITCISTQNSSVIQNETMVIFDNKLEEYKLNMIQKVPKKIRESFESKLFCCIVELAINVNEHANTDKFWIYAQNYPRKKRCEICIVDMGRGFLNSYTESGINLKSDEEAIKTAIHGGKSRTKDPNKGYGLNGLINMFVKTGNGYIFILSGKSAFYIFKDENENVSYDTYSLDKCEWNGSIVWTMFDMDTIK